MEETEEIQQEDINDISDPVDNSEEIPTDPEEKEPENDPDSQNEELKKEREQMNENLQSYIETTNQIQSDQQEFQQAQIEMQNTDVEPEIQVSEQDSVYFSLIVGLMIGYVGIRGGMANWKA